MKYTLSTSLSQVQGIGPKLGGILTGRGLFTVADLLLFTPLRYEDRSEVTTIAQLIPQELQTIKVKVVASSTFYRNRRSIQNATVTDGTGRLKVMWFNSPFVLDVLKKNPEVWLSGKLSDRGVMAQPVIEGVKTEAIHTGRLVPIYSQIATIKAGSLRRILKHLVDTVEIPEQPADAASQLTLQSALQHIHFPDSEESVVSARLRLATEELLSLMSWSHHVKEQWQNQQRAPEISSPPTNFIPETVPFRLTTAQQTATSEILHSLQRSIPMNRLLVGDVGSGKTVVAGIAAYYTLHQGYHVALVAPTQILAQQHTETLQRIFPTLSMQLLTAQQKTTAKKFTISPQPTFFIGTHAVINKLTTIKPALIIYDEQQRFGVKQRSVLGEAEWQPHVLTMTATPIPRTLMLTIFSHLQLSTLDELPAGRLPTKTWLVPDSKKADSYAWIAEQIHQAQAQKKPLQALIICPFIDPSHAEALENVTAAEAEFTRLQSVFAGKKVRLGLLHGRMSKKEQAEVTQQLYEDKLDVLVTTPIVEVGVDLPAATIIVIEAAERFGLASLHQLRGRVGRAGQQGYCLLFSATKSQTALARLKKFTTITQGSQVAELDLENRGAGDIFGTHQHGLDDLHFVDWADLELIKKARHIHEHLLQQSVAWKSLLFDQAKNHKPLVSAN